jgi:hypothetical protein
MTFAEIDVPEHLEHPAYLFWFKAGSERIRLHLFGEAHRGAPAAEADAGRFRL